MKIRVENPRHGHFGDYDVEVQEVYAVNRDAFTPEVKDHIFRYEDIVLIDQEEDVVMILISPDRVKLMESLGYALHIATDEYGNTSHVLGFIYSMLSHFVEFGDVIGEDDGWEYDWDDYDDTLPCGCCACCGCSCYDEDWYDEEDED